MLIQTEALQRMIKNALLFSNKTSPLHGDTIWWYGGYSVSVLSSDDYVILRDRAPIFDQGVPWYTLLPQEALREALRALKEASEDVVSLWEVLGHENVPEAMEDTEPVHPYVTAITLWKPSTNDRVAISPTRLVKLNRVEPKGYPVSLMFASVEGMEAVKFKIGPTVDGVILALNKDVLADQYSVGVEIW